jgi:hypothetical protein
VEERVRGMEDKIRQEIRQELRAEMKSEMAIMLRQAMGQQAIEPVFSPTVVQSSCQSVKPLADLSGFTEVMQIQIYFPLHVLVSYILFYSSKNVYLYRSQK